MRLVPDRCFVVTTSSSRNMASLSFHGDAKASGDGDVGAFRKEVIFLMDCMCSRIILFLRVLTYVW